MIKIELSRIYGNKPYYTVMHKDNQITYAFGYEQARKVVEKAIADGENIEIQDKVLEEHSRLVALLKPKKSGEKNEKAKNKKQAG